MTFNYSNYFFYIDRLARAGVFLFFLFSIIFLVSAASPLGSVVNGQNAQRILNSTQTRLVDIYSVGDSNQLFGDYGWDHGYQQAMLNIFGNDSMYGSGTFSMYDNGGQGGGIGYGAAADFGAIRYNAGGTPQNASSTPLSQHSNYYYTNQSAGITGNLLGQLAGFQGDGNIVNSGISIIGNASPLGFGQNESDLWVYRSAYGFFNTSWVNSSDYFQICAIQFLSTYSCKFVQPQTVNATTILLNGSDGNGVALSEFLVLNATKNNSVDAQSLNIRRQNPGSTSADSYPFYFVLNNLVLVNRTRGWQQTTIYAGGGMSASNASNWFGVENSSRVGNYVDFSVRYQITKGYDPMAIVFINFGTNDATQGVSAAQYKNDMFNITTIIREGWIAKGYNESNLQFVLITTHPLTASDSTLSPFRDANNDLANNYSYITAVDLSKLTNFTELNRTNAWPSYAVIGSDVNHLNSSSKDSKNTYAILATRVINEIVAYSSSSQPLDRCASLTDSTTGTYLLNQTISNFGALTTCIDIQASNITFDCQGNAIYNVTASSFIGISISSGAQGVTVKNCNVTFTTTGTNTGITITENNNTILNNTFTSMFSCISLSGANLTSVINNSLSYCEDSDETFGQGITFLSSEYNLVRGNSIFRSAEGIYLTLSSHNRFINNSIRFSNNSYDGNVKEGAAILMEAGNSNNTFDSLRLDNNLWGVRVNNQGTQNNSFKNLIINGSFNNSIHLVGVQTRNNTFSNITFMNGASNGFDFFSATANQNETILVDTVVHNYSFTGVGSKITWVDSDFGKIQFLSLVNGTGANLSAQFMIFNATIIINGTARNGGFNKSANLTFYNLANYNVPALYRDGTNCTLCYNFTSLSAGTVIINVTSAGNYSIFETSPTILTSVSSDSSGSSGGSPGSKFWANTYYHNQEDVASGRIMVALSARTQAGISFEGAYHTIGVVSIVGDEALIEVASSPQRALLKLGQAREFDLDGDSLADIRISVSELTQYAVTLIVEPASSISDEGSEVGQASDSDDFVDSYNETSNIRNQIGLILVFAFLVILCILIFLLKNKKFSRRY
ncbi:MAG: hypothetical protein AABW79_00915 [Nanoarchaeota archaeon]